MAPLSESFVMLNIVSDLTGPSSSFSPSIFTVLNEKERSSKNSAALLSTPTTLGFAVFSMSLTSLRLFTLCT